MDFLKFLLVCSTVFPVGSYRGRGRCEETNLYWRSYRGGIRYEIEDAPYTVWIKPSATFMKTRSCWRSLIFVSGLQCVLTTATCVLDWDSKYEINVYAGATIMPEDGILRKLRKAYVHPGFRNDKHDPLKRENLLHDIALIKLNQSFKLDAKIATIDLAPQGFEAKDGDKLFLTGWGEGKYVMGYEFEVQNNPDCGRFGQLPFEPTKTQMCTANNAEEDYLGELNAFL